MRTLESFAKALLIRFITEHRLSCNPVKELERIERNVRIEKLMRESDEILELQSGLGSTPSDIREFIRLSDKWDKLQEELDELLGLTSG